ncbi:hypothetical protein T11_14632 [Trichinella zimbabwensis]|uniref:Uncharacterized protein n=1 Tax=Trichinella zimbabwensis TaxID=268475 RepID=A0A0V1GTE7_9BILA|nr:hypothetical protein T11_14632 [Trichinella zimbabwensis]
MFPLLALWLSSSWRNYVKTVEQRWLWYTSCQRVSVSCHECVPKVVGQKLLWISFSMIAVLMATRVPLPIQAFPWRLSASWHFQYGFAFKKIMETLHPATVVLGVGINASKGDMKKSQQTASTQSELPLSPSRHHSYQNGMSAFASVSNVVSCTSQGRTVLPDVKVKAIHSGPQFRVAYGKE